MHKIDARDKRCPMPIVMLAREVRGLAAGDEVEIQANDPVFEPDLRAWVAKTGNILVSMQINNNGESIAIVKKKS